MAGLYIKGSEKLGTPKEKNTSRKATTSTCQLSIISCLVVRAIGDITYPLKKLILFLAEGLLLLFPAVLARLALARITLAPYPFILLFSYSPSGPIMWAASLLFSWQR
jgi:hypothetical protein